MSLKVDDSRKLLIKLVGTENILEQSQLVGFFRGILTTKVKTYLANVMKSNKINIFEVDENLEFFSKEIQKKLNEDVSEYGVYLNKFIITNIVKPDGNPQYEKFKDLHFRQYTDIAEAELKKKLNIIEQETESEKMIIESKAIAKKREQEGYTYQQERGFDVAEKMSENEAVGQFTNMGIGLGVMSRVGNTIGGTVNNAINSAFNNSHSNNQIKFCKNCGYKFVDDGNFCPNCGEKR